MSRSGLALLVVGGFAVAYAGCFETATLIPGGPTGGNTGAGANNGGGNTTSNGGEGNTCVVEECGGTDTDCRTRVCNPGCGFEFTGAGTVCDEDGGTVCNGAGDCVECTDNSHCSGANMVCGNNVCLPGNLGIGEACQASEQCTSGACPLPEGICCDAACDGACESCLGVNTCGTDGTCAPITAGTDPDVECGNDKCFAGACLPGTVAFVTSNAYNGNLGGLAGADALCAQHAADACLPGTYMAWLSDNVSSPSTRFSQQTIPYRLVDGTQIAVNRGSLFDNFIDAPLNLDENGSPAPASSELACPTPITTFVYTGTISDGTADLPENRCNEWTTTATGGATFGNYTEASNLWSKACSGPGPNICSFTAPLYCFQQ